MTESGSPLYPLLNEINKAAVGGLPFLAVAMTTALPDICVSLISDDGRSDGVRYKEWCDKNLGDEFSVVTGEDLWSMRCGVLHNGRFGDLKHNVARIIFSIPDGSGNVFANCQINDAYFYGVVEFCQNFTRAVYVWFENNRENENLRANLPRLMQYRQGGLSPYVRGATVLA